MADNDKNDKSTLYLGLISAIIGALISGTISIVVFQGQAKLSLEQQAKQLENENRQFKTQSGYEVQKMRLDLYQKIILTFKDPTTVMNRYNTTSKIADFWKEATLFDQAILISPEQTSKELMAYKQYLRELIGKRNKKAQDYQEFRNNHHEVYGKLFDSMQKAVPDFNAKIPEPLL